MNEEVDVVGISRGMGRWFDIGEVTESIALTAKGFNDDADVL